MIDSIKKYLEKKSITFFIGNIISFFLIGIIFGSFTPKPFSIPTIENVRCLSNLKFINPEPECEIFEQKLDKMNSLQYKLEKEIDVYLKSGRATRVSVFTRDLKSQRYVGVNESEKFFMASLLKVPLAIAYFRLSEITPDVLDKTVTYDGKLDLYANQTIEPLKKLIVGKEYSMRDLIKSSLAYSDNTAAEILSQNYVSPDYLEKVLLALGLQTKNKEEVEDVVTAKSYASVFRALYNSSFLTRKTSNEILAILSESSFTSGAVKNLPHEVKVAHKFGERIVLDKTTGEVTKKQLHDCGIVYAKNGTDPYTFCILTEGKDLSSLKLILQNISSTIYKEIVE